MKCCFALEGTCPSSADGISKFFDRLAAGSHFCSEEECNCRKCRAATDGGPRIFFWGVYGLKLNAHRKSRGKSRQIQTLTPKLWKMCLQLTVEAIDCASRSK